MYSGASYDNNYANFAQMTVLVYYMYKIIYGWPQKITVDQGGHLEFQNGVI